MRHEKGLYVLQILLRELQATTVSADMAADAMASVMITAPSKPSQKDGFAGKQARIFPNPPDMR